MKTAHNYFTQVEYQGMNAIELNATDYQEKAFATFLQWKENGYKVKKGSKGYGIITYVSINNKKVAGKDKTESGSVPRHYTVFNIAQVEKIND